MPLPMVHPAVAVRVKDKLKIEDDGAFYLGAIAPDAIHMREGASAEDKFRSHMGMRGNLFENERNAKALVGRSEVLTGCAVHLVTDMYRSREVGTAFKARFRAKFSDADHAPRTTTTPTLRTSCSTAPSRGSRRSTPRSKASAAKRRTACSRRSRSRSGGSASCTGSSRTFPG